MLGNRRTWQMVAPELKLTKKERDPHCPGLWLKERGRLNPEDSTSCLRSLKLTDTLEAAQAVERLHRMTTTNGKARMNAYKNRIGERESESKRGKELE